MTKVNPALSTVNPVNGIIAPLEAFRELQPRQIAGVGLVNASFRFFSGGFRSGDKRIRA